jgi:hypothetical protein
MSEDVVSIEILKEVPFAGAGDTLEARLRKVKLMGFPEVAIYEQAQFESVFMTPGEISDHLLTPQTRVYRDHLNKVAQLHRLFSAHGINILKLDRAYDFLATASNGEQTEWTMLPPIVERFVLPRTHDDRLDYAPLIGQQLQGALTSKGLGINPAILEMAHPSSSDIIDLVNDGMHRVHYGLENGGIRVLRVRGMTPGFPYYAVPQSYHDVKVFATRAEALRLPETKVHIVQDPAHKELYRNFPSGGIMSGTVRPH